jgi:cytochrome P450
LNIVSYLIQSPEHADGILVDSLLPKAVFLILAGTETTAAALSGAIYYLLASPEAHHRAVREVRESFQNAADINVESTRLLEYLKACVTESQRMYPSTPGAFPRRVPLEGATVCGQHVPGNTIVGISHFAAFRSRENFRNPDKYIPERWLEQEHSDKRSAFHPFSFGPRSCIGKE